MTTHSSARRKLPLSLIQRRLRVVAVYLGYLAMVLAWSFSEHPWRWMLVVPLGIITLLAFFDLLQPRRLGTSDGTDEELDERQVQIRNVGYLNAYRGLGGLATLYGLYYFIAGDTGWWLPTTENERTAFFWGIWGVAMSMPAAILAWTEPDVHPLGDD